jgi:hypothetical protein
MPAPIKDVLFFAGSNWNGSTPDEIVEALDIAGYVIVPKEQVALTEDEKAKVRAARAEWLRANGLPPHA